MNFWLTLLGASFLFAPATRGLADDVVIKVDGKSAGRTFEGIGGVSAGASSRLLIDYPRRQRDEILDFLFKPNYGASLQHLKVEIGADGNSTDGDEASFARTREEFLHPRKEHFDRGYEFWLMGEARRRNPHVILDALEWAAPAWIGDDLTGEARWYSDDNLHYIASFVSGAKIHHGLDISYVGLWNERYSKDRSLDFAKRLRRVLDSEGLTRTKIVASDDSDWNSAKAVLSNPEARRAVGAIGMHYPQDNNADDNALVQKMEEQSSFVPLWSSEDMALESDWKRGGLGRAQRINRNYILHGITKSEMWSLIAAYYPSLPFAGLGPMVAVEPWSGHYEASPALWAIAHTTQFAKPGWRYLDSASKILPDGGSVVALTNGKDVSIVIETSDAKAAQTLRFAFSNISAGNLHVWKSDSRSQFARALDVSPSGGQLEFQVDPQAVYTLTTTTGQRKGATWPPPSRRFPLPYSDDFQSYKSGGLPRYFADQNGAFEVFQTPTEGKTLRQVIRKQVVGWMNDWSPQTYFGDADWSDVDVEIGVHIETSGHAAVFGRIPPQSWFRVMPPIGYGFTLEKGGAWKLTVYSVDQDKPYDESTQKLLTLAAGVADLGTGDWHTLKLSMHGTQIRGFIDGKLVAEANDSTYAKGLVGLGTSYDFVQFRNLRVTPSS